MEAKKSKEANLENKKYVFRVIGLVMISAIVGMAFSVTSAIIPEKSEVLAEEDRFQEDVLEEFDIPEPEPEQQEIIAPPPPAPEEVIIEEDDVEIEEVNFDFDPNDIPPPDTGDGDDKIVAEPIVDFAEVEPAFPGGDAAMAQFIRDNIVYPELSREMGEQGTVYVQFVVNADGSIQDVKVVKSVSKLLDKEAIRVVERMPKWTPGEQAGKKVRVRFTLPINFRIQ